MFVLHIDLSPDELKMLCECFATRELVMKQTNKDPKEIAVTHALMVKMLASIKPKS